jgi:hypothetical protein
MSYVAFIPTVLSKYETVILTYLFFSTKTRDIFNFTCCQEVPAMSEYQHLLYTKKALVETV